MTLISKFSSFFSPHYHSKVDVKCFRSSGTNMEITYKCGNENRMEDLHSLLVHIVMMGWRGCRKSFTDLD